MSDKPSGSERLEELLGHNPSKQLAGNLILQEAMAEIQQARREDAKKKAKELLTKAIDLHQSITKADQEWRSKINKFNKELGKVLGSLDRFANGEQEGTPGCCCPKDDCCPENKEEVEPSPAVSEQE